MGCQQTPLVLPPMPIPQIVINTNVLDFHCAVATHHRIFFLWRPFLPDPKDDMVLELAVEAGCDSVVTYNIRDFVGIEQFGVSAVTPAKFLESIGALS